jgi:DNA-binding MarR family transcriptional regulator
MRAIHLSITGHGLKTLNELLPATIRSQEMILSSLPKEYRRIFKHRLETIVEANEPDLAELVRRLWTMTMSGRLSALRRTFRCSLA